MGELRHIAMSAPDPRQTAEFYKFAFGMEVIGKTDSGEPDIRLLGAAFTGFAASGQRGRMGDGNPRPGQTDLRR